MLYSEIHLVNLIVSMLTVTPHCAGTAGILQIVTYTVSQKKGATLSMAITLSILDHFQNSFTAVKSTKFPIQPILGYHHTLSMLLHYLGKLKNQKFALCMHVKHVSSVSLYHLFNRYLPNITKISANIN